MSEERTEERTERRVLGKCPKCGSDYVVGMYGPYCTGKCGFRVGHIFGAVLDEDQIEGLLSSKEVLLPDCKKKDGSGTFQLVVKMSGVREFDYTTKSGEDKHGFDVEVDRWFPDKRPDSQKEETVGTAPESGRSVQAEETAPEDTPGVGDMVDEEFALPFV